MLNFSLLGYVEVVFLKRYPYPCQTDTHKSKCSSSLGLSWESNEARLGWQVGARLTDKAISASIEIEVELSVCLFICKFVES